VRRKRFLQANVESHCRSIQQCHVQSSDGHVLGESGTLEATSSVPELLHADGSHAVQTSDSLPKDTVLNVERTGEFCW
jgi:hypothetical protein